MFGYLHAYSYLEPMINSSENRCDRRAFDVAVAGGGVAGIAAAHSAARRGARTCLIERYGFLGGMATAAMVCPFMSHRSSTGQPLVAGFFEELRGRLAEMDAIVENSFDVEALKFVAQEMLLDAGVELVLHSWVTGVEMRNDSIAELALRTKGGEERVAASVFVDATGDGDVAFSAGAPFQKGRAEDGAMQAMTLKFDIAGVDLHAALEWVKANPDQVRFPKIEPGTDIRQMLKGVVSIAGYYDLVKQAKEKGELNVPGDLVFFISRPRPGEVVVNTTHIGMVDGTRSEDLTRAEIEGRRQMMSLMRFFRDCAPGFESCYLARSGVQVGVRETRRITGEYVFTAEDVEAARKFPDAIGRLAYWVDVHSPKGEGYTRGEETTRRLAPPPGDWYEIPYRCLLPLGVRNLLIAGKCVSSTHEGHGAIRVMPSCMAMGQAAGTAAAIAASAGVSPKEIDVEKLLSALREAGALV
ncbi:MAG: FAD-dependent oxidoreductase [Armatimonadota bacterium]|nr:FAD-dependent oxidoreductase [Armatimonadota bacterium]